MKGNKHKRDLYNPKNSSSIKNRKKPNSKRILITFICIFVSSILLFGGILLTVTLARQASYTVKYDGFGIDTKTTAYFASYCKEQYMALLREDGINPRDTEEFWNSVGEGREKTYGEYFEEYTAEFIKETIVGAYLFDKYSSLTEQEEEKIKNAISYKLDNDQLGMDGTEKTFNLKVKEYGFDYDSYLNAAEILYKSWNAGLILGDLLTEAFPDGYDEYFTTYVHVRLLFINNDKKLNNDGKLVDMTNEEKQKLESDLAKLRGYIANGTAGLDVFETYFKYDTFYVEGLPETNGEFYLGEGEDFTNFLNEYYPEVVQRAFEMELADNEAFAEVAYDGGVCFIYKTPSEDEAYNDETLQAYFNNFNENASSYLYDSILKLYSEDAVITDKFYEMNIASIPYNSAYFIRAI